MQYGKAQRAERHTIPFQSWNGRWGEADPQASTMRWAYTFTPALQTHQVQSARWKVKEYTQGLEEPQISLEKPPGPVGSSVFIVLVSQMSPSSEVFLSIKPWTPNIRRFQRGFQKLKCLPQEKLKCFPFLSIAWFTLEKNTFTHFVKRIQHRQTQDYKPVCTKRGDHAYKPHKGVHWVWLVYTNGPVPKPTPNPKGAPFCHLSVEEAPARAWPAFDTPFESNMVQRESPSNRYEVLGSNPANSAIKWNDRPLQTFTWI